MARRTPSLAVIFLTIFIDLLGWGIVLPLLPRYAEDLQASGLMLGLLMSSYSACQFLFAPMWGRVSDRIGRRPVLILGLIASVLCYLVFAWGSLAKSLTLLFLARIGAGIAGATVGTASAYIADVTDSNNRTSGMALIGAAFGIGFAVGPALGALALHLDSLAASRLSPYPGYLAALVSAVALVLALFVLPESLTAERRAALAKTAGKSRWWQSSTRRILAEHPQVAALITLFALNTIGFSMFESTLSLLTKAVFGLQETSNFYLFSYVGFIMLVAQGYVVRKLAKRVADYHLAMTGVFLIAAGILLLLGSIQATSLNLLLLSMPISITGVAFLNTSLQAMISKGSPADKQGEILGINQAGSSLARIVGPALALPLFKETGITVPYWGCIALMVVVLLLLRRLRPPAADEPAAVATAPDATPAADEPAGKSAAKATAVAAAKPPAKPIPS